MQLTSGPARYFFLRRPRGAKEELTVWPPEIKPLQQPDNWICVAVYLYAEDYGWRAVPVRDEADLTADAGGAFVLTRETMLGLTADTAGPWRNTALALLGVRVVQPEPKGPEIVSHLVVHVAGSGVGLPKHPIVVPVTSMVLGNYVEHGTQAEAQLDLRLSGPQLGAMPPYLPDPLIERNVNRMLDEVIYSPRQRHEIKPEVEAGRVTLFGRAELTTIGDVARQALGDTAGVIEVVDHVLYGELLMAQVREALVGKGYSGIDVRYEHGLIELDGTVATQADVHKMRDMILKIPGIRGVVTNQVNVVPPVVAVAPEAPPPPAGAPVGTNGKTTPAASPSSKAEAVPRPETERATPETPAPSAAAKAPRRS